MCPGWQRIRSPSGAIDVYNPPSGSSARLSLYIRKEWTVLQFSYNLTVPSLFDEKPWKTEIRVLLIYIHTKRFDSFIIHTAKGSNIWLTPVFPVNII